MKPIVFTPHMARSIIDRRKTMTRRVVNPQPVVVPGTTTLRFDPVTTLSKEAAVSQAPWKPGDLLWVKESIYYDIPPWCDGGSIKVRPEPFDPGSLYYRADGECCEQIPECCCSEVGKPKWRSPRFMPKWASRIEIEITDVRLERLHDITTSDIVAEGISIPGTPDGAYAMRIWGKHAPVSYLEHGRLAKGRPPLTTDEIARMEFASGWDAINEKRGFSWVSNPWVWVAVFKFVVPEEEPSAHHEGYNGHS